MATCLEFAVLQMKSSFNFDLTFELAEPVTHFLVLGHGGP